MEALWNWQLVPFRHSARSDKEKSLSMSSNDFDHAWIMVLHRCLMFAKKPISLETRSLNWKARIPHKTHIIRHMLIMGLAFSEDAKYQRAAVLNESCKPRIWTKSGKRNTRNVAAHGGNVLADIQVIQDMEKENPSTADRWKGAFSHLYELDYWDFNLPLLCAPKRYTEVARICNVLATILLVKPWRLKSQRCKEKRAVRIESIIAFSGWTALRTGATTSSSVQTR